MADWSLMGDGQRFDTVGETSPTDGATVTANVSANTEGAYTQLVASTLFDAGGFLVIAGNNNKASFLLDIAMGAAAAEQIIVADLLYQVNTRMIAGALFIPLPIPAGTRIAARCQSSGGSNTMRATVTYFAGGWLLAQPLSRCTTYGSAAADSGGSQLDPGGTANTKGAYTELTASCTEDIKALLIAVGNGANTASTNGQWLLDVAVGAATSEQIIIPDLFIESGLTTNLTMMPAFIGPIPVNIPSATRIAARVMSTVTDATDRLIDVVVYGFS